MRRNRPRRWYISCRQVKKADYQKALLARHQVVFAKTPDEAQLVLLPQDHGGLTAQQKEDFQKATELGISCVAFSENLIYHHDISDLMGLELMGRDSSASVVSDMTGPAFAAEAEDEDILELTV